MIAAFYISQSDYTTQIALERIHYTLNGDSESFRPCFLRPSRSIRKKTEGTHRIIIKLKIVFTYISLNGSLLVYVHVSHLLARRESAHRIIGKILRRIGLALQAESVYHHSV